MYERITGEDPYDVPMRIYPATHYTMGGLWVDYNLMTTIPGLYAAGEANFSDHGANRLGASALMQGLADGYFVLPYTIGDYLAPKLNEAPLSIDDPAFIEAEADVQGRIQRFLSIGGTQSPEYFHRELGKLVWDYIGMERDRNGLEKAITEIRALRDEFWTDLRVLGESETLNSSIEKAGRVADFFELAELMARDALDREESCGGHFREESQTEEGEAQRDDENFSHVSAWEWHDADTPQTKHIEELTFEEVSRQPEELQVMSKKLNLTLSIWRQPGPDARGQFVTYPANGIPDDASFLEMLDMVNEELIEKGEVPIEFPHDCREGICGTCGVMINGRAHGQEKGTATCQLHMRKFNDGDTIVIEPWRAAAFPVVRDLVVDRSPLDKIIEAGGFITAPTGTAADANETPIPKEVADSAMDAAACIGCGACVAACPNSAGQLFTSAKLWHLNSLPQGQAERYRRTQNMVETMEEFFGSCTNHGECTEACPKEISQDFIAYMNRDYMKSLVYNRKLAGQK